MPLRTVPAGDCTRAGHAASVGEPTADVDIAAADGDSVDGVVDCIRSADNVPVRAVPAGKVVRAADAAGIGEPTADVDIAAADGNSADEWEGAADGIRCADGVPLGAIPAGNGVCAADPSGVREEAADIHVRAADGDGVDRAGDRIRRADGMPLRTIPASDAVRATDPSGVRERAADIDIP